MMLLDMSKKQDSISPRTVRKTYFKRVSDELEKDMLYYEIPQEVIGERNDKISRLDHCTAIQGTLEQLQSYIVTIRLMA